MRPDEFREPEQEYRGVTLWMLNDLLQPNELRRQLRGFKEAGWGAVITRTFNGLRTEYLGEEWMQALDAIVETAAELGMKVWFQAGYMPNGIPDLPAEFEHRVLTARPKDEPAGDGEEVLGEDDACAYVASRLEHVLDMINPRAVGWYLRRAYEETWLARFGEHFGGTVEAVWVDEPCLRPGRLPWCERVWDAFGEAWGYPIQEHFVSLFRREGDWRKVRHHYWRTVLELFTGGYFETVSRWCAEHGVKFTGHLMGEDALRPQVGFNASVMPLYPFMGVPGIDHLTGSLRWWHGRSSGAGGHLFVQTPKQCSSAANQSGQSEVLAEMYGVSTQGLTFADRKRVGEWFALLGINYRCLHGSYYSMRGRRKRIYPPHLSHQQPWWPENRMVADYFARLSYALRGGRYAADVLVLSPVESAFCVYEPEEQQYGDAELRRSEIDDLNDSFARLSENLLRAQCCFDYGDERMLAERGGVDGDRIEVGPMRYRVVVLPSLLTLRRTTVELIERFLDGGGTVLCAGDFPTCVDGAPGVRLDALKARVAEAANEPAALRAALDAALPGRPAVTSGGEAAEDIFLHERAVEGARLFYLLNTGDAPHADAALHVRDAGRLEEWDPATGEVRALPHCEADDGTAVSLSFEPWQSHLLLFRPGASETVPAAPRRLARTIALSETWELERHDPNALTLDFCRLRRGGADYGAPVPVIAVQQILETDDPYRGPISLLFEFQIESVPAALSVAVEDAPDWSIAVNGQPVRYAGMPWWVDRSFMPVDVTAHVRPGANTVELSRQFEPLGRAGFAHAQRFADIPGVEVESIHLIGDFAVRGEQSSKPPRRPCRRLAPGFVLCEEPATAGGDLVVGGYPFYAGRVTLRGTVSVDSPAEVRRAVFCLERVDACLASVRVNGSEAGVAAWAPWEVDVTGLLRPGENEIEIGLTNTLRNLLGPHHRPAGEPDNCWGEVAFSGSYSRETGRAYPRWYEDREQDTDAWTDDYFFLPFGLGGVTVRLESEEDA